MKKLVILLFAVMLAGQAWAQNFAIGKLLYTVTDATNNYVSVSRASNTDTPSGDLVIPESVTDPEASGEPYTVTSIANYAFHSCANITSVSIPSTVTSIGMQAFYNCTSLTTVFIPSSITEISFDVFEGCVSLAAINIAEGNANYASVDGVLFNNDKTELLYYPASKTGSSYSIPGTVTKIGSSAFENCSNLTSITIPNTVVTIQYDAFYNCSNLVSITIPESVFNLGNSVFYGCSKLTEINVASGNSNYLSEDGVLFNKAKTKLICYPASKASSAYTVPESVTTIDESAFYGCGNLKSVVIPNDVTSLGDGVFQNCASLESVTLPNSITYIPSAIFGGCTNLTSIELPNTVTFIGNSAFSGSGLTTLEIPNSVTEISSYAFQDCKSLTSVIIPISVSDIGMNAFKGCSNATLNCEIGEKPDGWSDWWNYSNCTVVWGYGSGSNTWTVNLSANNSSYGNVSGGGTYANGSTITITATPASGYKFVKWSNSLTTAIATITVTSDTSLVAEFAEIEVSSLQYEITSSNTVQVVHSEDYKNLTGIVIPETIEIDGKTYTVTSIGGSAFSGCASLKTIAIPNTVTTISGSAFQNCRSLNSITLPQHLTEIGQLAFGNCVNLSSIIIPISVTKIGISAFFGCSGVTIYCEADSKPGGWSNNWNSGNTVVWGYGSGSKTWTVTLSANNAAYGSVSGGGSVTDGTTITITATPADGYYFVKWSNGLTSGKTTITVTSDTTLVAEFAEFGVSSLQYKVTGDNTVEVVRADYYKDLTYVVIPETVEIDGKTYKVTRIGNSAFESCSRLTFVSIPNSVSSIGEYAFSYTYMTSLDIPNSVTEIGDGAFGMIKNVVYNGKATGSPWNALTVNGYIDGKCIFADAEKTHLTAFITSRDSMETIVDIPESVLTIGSNAYINVLAKKYGDAYYFGNEKNPYLILWRVGDFSGDSEITSYEIKDGCKYIYYSAFSNMDALESVTIPNSVVSIGNCAFFGCDNLKSVDISNSVIVIGEDVFGNCGGLESVTIGNSVTTIGDRAFCECYKLSSVNIPNSVTTIGEGAFWDCESISSITIPKSVTTIGKDAFGGWCIMEIYCGVNSKPDGWDADWNSSQCPVYWAKGSTSIAVSESSASAVNIYASGNTIVVENATDEICIYDAMGKLVCRDAINRVRTEITVNIPGVYIVKTGSTVKRVMVN